MNIARPLLSLLLCAPPALALAQEDPLKSSACGAALAGLQAARQAQSDAATLETLRGAAAGACLGGAGAPQRPGRVAQPPVAVPPPQIELPARVAPPRAPAPPPPPVAIERAPLPAPCDAGGCWSNDGTHLRHVAPGLPGPHGLCSQQGGLVYCP